MLHIGTGRSAFHKNRLPQGNTGPSIALSANTVTEGASVNTVIGALSVVNPLDGDPTGWTFVETADPDTKFNISSANLRTSGTWDYETATSHQITVTASKSGQTDIVQTLTVGVTNVLEVTLGTVALDSLAWSTTSSSSGSITGKTSGSTVTLSGSLPSGLTLDLTAMTWAWAGGGSVATGSFNLVETHPDGNNSPKSNTQSYAISSYPTFNSAALNDALNTTGRAVLALGPGDSLTASWGAITASSPHDAADNSTTAALAAELVAMGANVSRDCFSFGDRGSETPTPADVTDYYSGRVVFSAGWTIYGAVPHAWGTAAAGANAGETITITPRQSQTTIGLFYLQYGTNGDLTVDRGGAAQSISTAGTHAMGYVEFTFPAGTQDFVIKFTGAFGIVFACRMWNTNVSRQIVIDTLGIGGFQTGNWKDASQPPSPFNALPNLHIDAACMMLGTNDKGNGETSANYQTFLGQLVDQIKTGTAPNSTVGIDVMLAVPPPAQSGSAYDFDATWKAIPGAVATAKSLRAPLDLNAPFTPQASYTAKYSDTIHLNSLGYGDAGYRWAHYL